MRRISITVLLLAALSLCSMAQNTAPQPPSAPHEAKPQAALSPAPQELPTTAAKTFPPKKIHEKVIGEMALGSEFAGARSSDSRLAWIEKVKDQRTVKFDGVQQGGTYEDVRFLTISKDEQHLAFAAKRRSKWVVVVNSEEKTQEYGRVTAMNLSADGKHLAFGACREKKCHVVLDGQETGPEFEDISYPKFSQDGSHYSYGGKRNRRWVMLLDGKELGPEMQDFLVWFFSPDGNHLAVAALMKNGWTWIVDGNPGPAYEVISPLSFSEDSKHFTYGGSSSSGGSFGKKQKVLGALVVDGKVQETYEGRGFGGGWQGVFATYSIASGLRAFRPDFHGLSTPDYAPNGGLIYAARKGEDNVVVFANSETGPPIEDLVSPIASTKDARHIGYIAKRGDTFVEMRDHKPTASFPGKREVSFVDTMAISEDGEHLAYVIVRGGNMFKQGSTERALRRVVLDSQAGPEYDALDIENVEFNSNGKHFFYEVRGARGDRDLVVFDGMEGLLYDAVFRNSTKFIDDTSIEFVAREGQKFLRVTQSLD